MRASPEEAAKQRKKIATLMTIAPRTVAELCQRTGCSDTFVRHHLDDLKAAGLCHISAYRSNGNRGASSFSALLSYGPGEDSTPPNGVTKIQANRKLHDARVNLDRSPSSESVYQAIGKKVACYGGLFGLA
jgi:DNA-binding transcriptional regulator LsrR (DeoR family)